MFEAWTDYPIEELGDESGKKAPIRKIEVLSYDMNKYCCIRVKGTEVIEYIKRGYIYSKEGRCGSVPTVHNKKYNGLPNAVSFYKVDWEDDLLDDVKITYSPGKIQAFHQDGRLHGIWDEENKFGWVKYIWD